MTLLPFRCHPLLKPRVWGGQKLLTWGKSLPDSDSTLWGESWELADLPEEIPEGRSIIRDGPLAGQTFRDAMDQHAQMLMGDLPRSPHGGFPLLVKLLDAQRNLSVQVHPTAEFAANHEGAYKKDEASPWFGCTHRRWTEVSLAASLNEIKRILKEPLPSSRRCTCCRYGNTVHRY